MPEHRYAFPNHNSPLDSSPMSFKSAPVEPPMPATMTPSPPFPSPTGEPFLSRSLPPLEPQHSAIPSYLTNQRRGSITDPSLHLSVPKPELRQYSQTDVNFASNIPISPPTERRGSFVMDNYPASPSSSLSRPPSVKSEHSFSLMDTRNKHRETLPSISASASPIRDGFPGPLMNPAFQAQFAQRRHSIAVGEVVSPVNKRKSSLGASVLSNSINPDDYAGKRRDSMTDPISRLSLYDRRSSYSAPSSPPAQPSSSPFASSSSPMPKLNVHEVDNSLQAHADATGLHHPYGESSSELPPPSNMGLQDQTDTQVAYPPFNHRVSQIVHEDVNGAPILARRASMPQMSLNSRFGDHGQQEATPMDIDRYRSHGYTTHSHSYHPYAYEYPGYPTTPSVKDTPYSRSPELRISHKLAERKRRKEMKDLFDELRDSLPVDKSLKTSKWEILSKAVDYINRLKQNQDDLSKEVESLRQQLAAFKGCSSGSSSSSSSSGNNNNSNTNNSNSNNNNNNNGNSINETGPLQSTSS